MRYLHFPITALALAALAAGCTRAHTQDTAQLTPRSEVARSEAPVQNAASETPPASRLLPPPETLTDPFITAKVKASLMTDPAMSGADVSVNTDHGVVSLTGLVESQEQAAVASAHAQREDGVMRVDNHLAVNLH
jgi:hyperosmotically inducible protein